MYEVNKNELESMQSYITRGKFGFAVEMGRDCCRRCNGEGQIYAEKWELIEALTSICMEEGFRNVAQVLRPLVKKWKQTGLIPCPECGYFNEGGTNAY